MKDQKLRKHKATLSTGEIIISTTMETGKAARTRLSREFGKKMVRLESTIVKEDEI